MASASAPVTLRLARVGDDDALSRLAQLDSSPPLDGAVLLAEVKGRPVAALGLVDGRSIADPFERTAELVGLLALRASQMHEGRPPGGKTITRRRPERPRRLPSFAQGWERVPVGARMPAGRLS